MFVESVPVWQWHRGVENIDKCVMRTKPLLTSTPFVHNSVIIWPHVVTVHGLYFNWRWLLSQLFMMTSSNGNIFRVTRHLCGEFTGLRWILRTKASGDELWCFFDLRLNKRLSKQSWGWWFKTQPRPLWRHSNGFSLSWWLWKHVRLCVSADQNKASKIKAK